MKILVTGGTGKVGGEVVKQLQKRNADIRLLVRKESEATPKGVEVAVGDLLDPVSVQKALHGVDKLYLLNAVAPDELTQGLIAYDLAKRLKLKHIVYHSVFRVDHFKDVPHFASKLTIENALREFDVPFTIIRPNYFSQNDATLKDPLTKAGIYPIPLGDVGVSAVDIRDIAEATAIVLTSDEHYGETYNLNGPEALSGPKAASIWSKLLGKEIRYGGHDMDAFEEQMRNGAPSWSAFDVRMMFQGYLERGFLAEDGDLETLTKLLGHGPRRYEDFARETFAQWQEMSKAA
ncbi:MAG: NmrA family NAD(P)-binding protein [Candidatus Korobacteraceae bacterium]